MTETSVDYVTVSSMMPRPILRQAFHLTYRRIPVVAIGREIYSDTALIVEALEYYFPAEQGYRTLYPATIASDGRTYRPVIRALASFWSDLPFYRTCVGLMSGDIWRSQFGKDRAGLIGHVLDADKLERKIPRNLADLDVHLSLLEPQFQNNDKQNPWLFPTPHPSYGDVAAFFMLDWIYDISAGRGVSNLTGGALQDWNKPIMDPVFNADRYPALHSWWSAMRHYCDSLPNVEISKSGDATQALEALYSSSISAEPPLLPTTNGRVRGLEDGNGMYIGAQIVITPQDTGKQDPVFGKILALSPEEVVIEAEALHNEKKPLLEGSRLHFPRIGYLCLPRSSSSSSSSKL